MTRCMSARAGDGRRQQRKRSVLWPGAPMPSLSPRLTTIGKVRCTLVAFRKSSTRPVLVSRGHGRAPVIGTRTLARPELAEFEEERKAAWLRAACPPARTRKHMRNEREKDRCRMPGRRVKVKLRPRAAALDPPDRRGGRRGGVMKDRSDEETRRVARASVRPG